MNFSLHSFDGHPQDKEGYVRSILSFIREATSQSDLIVSLRLWNLTQDNKTNAEIRKIESYYPLLKMSLIYLIKLKRSLHRKGIKIAERVFINQDYEFQWPALHEEEDDGKGFCHGLRNQAGILANGTVIPCCLDGEGIINLGNINNDSFSNIIEGERATNIVDGFSRRVAVEELCRKCGYRKRFGK